MVGPCDGGCSLQRSLGLASRSAASVGCTGARPAAGPDERRVTGVELAALEIRHDQVDRFEHCPPAGEIGQDWLPAMPEWHPPAANASAAVPESAVARPG